MKRITLKLTALVIAVPLMFSSCATILGKSNYPISINSNPTAATISITNKSGREIYKGQSPATVELKSSAGFFSKAEYQVKITSPGYAEQIIPINFKLDGLYFGNILFGGVLGMLIIDPATGAMWKLKTPPISVTLNKSTTLNEIQTLKIIDIANIPQDMKDNLVRIK